MSGQSKAHSVAQTADKVAHKASEALQGKIPDSEIAMGHPIHPSTVHWPIAVSAFSEMHDCEVNVSFSALHSESPLLTFFPPLFTQHRSCLALLPSLRWRTTLLPQAQSLPFLPSPLVWERLMSSSERITRRGAAPGKRCLMPLGRKKIQGVKRSRRP